MTRPDITYRDDGLFTAFTPESEAGMHPWRVIANGTDGTAKVLSVQAKQTIKDLRRSGYLVRKAKSITMSDAELLAALEE